jgi:hypothetical protein
LSGITAAGERNTQVVQYGTASDHRCDLDCGYRWSRIIPINLIIRGLIMTHEQIAIIALLAMQAVTLIILWRTHVDREWFRNAWLREGTELLSIKQRQD